MLTILKNFPGIHRYGLKARHYFWQKRTQKQLISYLKSEQEKKLHLGAGQNKLEGWFNTDYFPRKGIYFLDVTRPFSIPNNSFDYAFSEHQIEHIHYKEAKWMVREVFQALKLGGVFRICTPDFTTYINSNSDKNAMQDPFVKETIEHWIKPGFYNAKNYQPTDSEANITFLINDIFLNYDHKFIYDFETLKNLLYQEGFRSVKRLNASKSSHPSLTRIEAHPPTPFTLTVEAVK